MPLPDATRIARGIPLGCSLQIGFWLVMDGPQGMGKVQIPRRRQQPNPWKVRRPAKIARHYIRTWLLPDTALVTWLQGIHQANVTHPKFAWIWVTSEHVHVRLFKADHRGGSIWVWKKCKTALEMSDISVSDACRIAWFSSCLRFHHKSGGTPILGKPYIFLLMVIGLLYTIRIYYILVSKRSHWFDPRFSLRWSLSSWRSSQPQTLRMPPGQGVTRHCGQLLDIAGIIWYLWTCQEFSRFFC